MFSLFLEHYTIKSARRALIVSSFLTLLLPGLEIKGDGLNIFGLILDINKNQILITMRIVSAYFLWVFLWINIFDVSKTAQGVTDSYFSNLIEKARDAASSVDYDPDERDGWEPDIEPWWEHFAFIRSRANTRQRWVQTFLKGVLKVAVTSVEYLPPMLIGFCAVFYPVAVHCWLFYVFGL